MLLACYKRFYDEIFAIPGFFSDPVLSFGFQDIDPGVILSNQQYSDLPAYLTSLGIGCKSLDFFDPRAEMQYDMNLPVPREDWSQYGTFIDMGSIEHVFDTRQCMENCFRMVRRGGYYMLNTPVNGYYGHGFHVFNAECLLAALELNGFRVVYEKYSSLAGEEVSFQSPAPDTLAWIVAVKAQEPDTFTCPQQGKWLTRYDAYKS